MRDILNEAIGLKEDIINWRRALHRIPEIGLYLPKTREYITKYLDELGIDYKLDNATSGIVATIDSGKEGKTIGLRTDMDALPVKEKNEFKYRSTNEYMHACGHDAHMAMMLGAVKILHNRREALRGRVKIIFQPGEEGYCGARVMLEDGILQSMDIDRMIGMHVTNDLPGLKNGMIGVGYGPIMASSDTFRVKIIGKGSHGARPERGIDPVVISAHVITALQNIVSREIGISEKLVITVGKICGGTVPNTIPDSVTIEGTVRTLDEGLRRKVAKRIEKIIENITESMLGTYELDYEFRYPPVVNDIDFTKEISGYIEDVLGKENIVELASPIMAGEDISYFFQKIPGTYLHLGSILSDVKQSFALHNPMFKLNEEVLYRGTAVLANSAIKWLENN